MEWCLFVCLSVCMSVCVSQVEALVACSDELQTHTREHYSVVDVTFYDPMKRLTLLRKKVTPYLLTEFFFTGFVMFINTWTSILSRERLDYR